MSDSKVMIKAPMKKVKARFPDYEDMEFEKRGDWTLAEDYSGTQLFGWGTSDWVEAPTDWGRIRQNMFFGHALKQEDMEG